jgi:hypothetical protein
MADIATPEELATSLQIPDPGVDTGSAELYLELAQGLITEKIGEQEPWPAVAKAIALAAAGRPCRNPGAAKRLTSGPFTADFNPEQFGVYLTDDEKERLADWAAGNRPKVGTIRTTSAYPPVAECEPPWWIS